MRIRSSAPSTSRGRQRSTAASAKAFVDNRTIPRDSYSRNPQDDALLQSVAGVSSSRMNPKKDRISSLDADCNTTSKIWTANGIAGGRHGRRA